MRWSRFWNFLRRDWAEFKSEFFAIPSPIAILSLLLLGGVLALGAYDQRRTYEEVFRRLEQVRRQSDLDAEAILREGFESAADELRKHGVPESEISQMKNRLLRDRGESPDENPLPDEPE